ncbi:replication initiator [Streptomyces angustmyceticus]|uniref:replication initiator n=1 Tax=Streptomyces angustmyceticus TaxID=285578 RepID=UPI003D91A987
MHAPATTPIPHSPAVRELLALAADGNAFHHIQAQVEHVAGCTRPVQLTGYTATLDATTGKPLSVYTTADEPTGRLLLACGNRRASVCPACSRLYAADTYHLIRAGLTGGKSVPDTVTTHPKVFATLTAPSFGPVHNRPGNLKPCRCGTHHAANDPALGTPLDPITYDYCGAVLFNAHAGALWHRFTVYLRRHLAHHAGIKRSELASVLRLSFAKVAEYQKRGAVHFHAVVRLDGPDGPTSPPPAWATPAVLTDAITAAAAGVRLVIESDALGRHELSWGEQIDARPITATLGADGTLTDAAVAGYVAKYATKGAEATGTLNHALYCVPCKGSGQRSDGSHCRPCHGSGEGQPLRHLVVERHVRQLIRTCWHLGQLPEFEHLGLWRSAHMLGYRGHFSTKSRRYSTTLGALRDTRRQWRTERARERLGLTGPDAPTLTTESAWAYLGTGYTPGEELLAATVRRNRADALRLKDEGEPSA